jgi:hypothetical protein
MSSYYVYFLDGNGRVYTRREIENDGDAQAIEAATTLLMAHPMRHLGAEVWQGARLVRKLAWASTTPE